MIARHFLIMQTIIIASNYFLPFLSSSGLLVSGKVISDDNRIRSIGWMRSYYDDDKDAESFCKNVLVLGVGTGMTTFAYDKLSDEIAVASESVTFIVDHNPWFLTKNSEARFANLAKYVMDNLGKLVPACNGIDGENRKLIIGGHSASGGAAWRAISLLATAEYDTAAAGYIGLDPFRLEPDEEPKATIPTLNWGLSTTSCGVTANNAAKAGYQSTDSKAGRIFYQVNNDSDGKGHCDFADNGCYGPVCAPSSDAEAVRNDVARSVDTFIQSLYNGNFEKDDYDLPPQDDNQSSEIKLFINEDSAARRRTRYLRR